MSKTTHTPGPWSLTKYAYQNYYSVQAFTGMQGLPRETGYTCMASPGPHGKDNAAVQEANARLIAAAPDMLAELKACEDMLLGAIPHATRIRDLLTERLASVRATIAKAEG